MGEEGSMIVDNDRVIKVKSVTEMNPLILKEYSI